MRPQGEDKKWPGEKTTIFSALENLPLHAMRRLTLHLCITAHRTGMVMRTITVIALFCPWRFTNACHALTRLING